MKKMFLMMALVMCCVGMSWGQEDFCTYENSYAEKTYKIQINYKDSTDFSLWIDLMSFDRMHENVGICVKKYEKFTETLQQAKGKYNEWRKTAIDNKVEDLSKDMEIKNRVEGYFLYGSDWHFQFYVNLNFRFKIIKRDTGEILYLLIIETGKLVASDNQFMDVEGGALVFQSDEEISEFLDLISLDKIISFGKKPDKGELFK